MEKVSPLPKLLERSIKNAWQAASLSAVLTLIFAIYPWFDGLRGLASFYNLPYVLISSGLAYGIYRRSRVCAILMLLVFIATKVSAQGPQTNGTIMMTMFLLFFSSGVAGTFLYHRYQRLNHFSKRNFYIITIISLVFSLALLFSASLGLNYLAKNNESSVWNDLENKINSAKEKQPLPLRIDYYTVLQDYYVYQKTLTYKYSVENIELSEISSSELYKKNLDAFQAFCNEPILVLYDLHVDYVYIKGFDEKIYSYNAKDCKK